MIANELITFNASYIEEALPRGGKQGGGNVSIGFLVLGAAQNEDSRALSRPAIQKTAATYSPNW